MEKIERKKIKKLQKEFVTQQLMFKKSDQESQTSTHARYVITYEIAKRGKPLLKGEFIKDCMLKIAEIVCPDKQRAFQNVSLSQMTIMRRVEEIGSDINDQLKSDIENIYLCRWLWMSPQTFALQLNFSFFYARSNRKLSNFRRTFCYDKFERSNARFGSLRCIVSCYWQK